jgi:hypothetical protein
MRANRTTNPNDVFMAILKVRVEDGTLLNLHAKERFACRYTETQLICPRCLTETGITDRNVHVCRWQETSNEVIDGLFLAQLLKLIQCDDARWNEYSSLPERGATHPNRRFDLRIPKENLD